MGFDLYGIDPFIKEGYTKPEPLQEYPGHPGEYDSNCWNRDEYDSALKEYYDTRNNDEEYQKLLRKYYNDLDNYKKDNPGIYFRSNVWYWRPVVEWLTEHIEVLDEDDLQGLSYNDGHIINVNVANIIAKTIAEHNKSGQLEEWVKHKKVEILMLGMENCELCEATGVRTDSIIFNAGLEPFTKNGREGFKCNGCNGEGQRPPFQSNYPYSANTLIQFGIFCGESGGFQIC